MTDKGVCRTAPATPGLLKILIPNMQVQLPITYGLGMKVPSRNFHKGSFYHLMNESITKVFVKNTKPFTTVERKSPATKMLWDTYAETIWFLFN